MTAMPNDRIRVQVALVEEHVRHENAHDVVGIMTTFGPRAWYDDEPWGDITITVVSAYARQLFRRGALVTLP